MPQIQLSPDATMFYRDDDLSDPWRESETVLMLHGNGESGLAWNGWLPQFGRRFRVVRPDMRGFGRSTPMPNGYDWTIDEIVDDYHRLIERLELRSAHVIASKTGGPIALRLAATYPDFVRTLTLVGSPGTARAAAPDPIAMCAEVERDGVESWARSTMGRRLGSDCTPKMLEGWSKLMGATALSTQLGYIWLCTKIDIAPDLPRIVCPTLVVTTVGSGLGSIVEMREWQERIANSELAVLPGDSYHVAASHPDLSARTALAFIDRVTRLN